MASFVRDPGHADRYPKLTVNYINYHNPDLLLFDADDEEVQRIDLTRLKTTANIHKVCKMLGMKETCRDLNPSCPNWSKEGQCDANPAYMHEQCRKSCGICAQDASVDDSTPCVNTAAEHDCEYWSTMGECTANEAFMRTACARSCGICKVKEHKVPSDDDDFFDDDFKDEL